jgi:hypothetical protein
VGDYATSITYHPNRMINQVVHGNGPVDTQQNDPNHLRRPASIATRNGATTMWSTGTYTYDGAGNIAKMGTSGFTYDKARTPRVILSTSRTK